MIRGHDETHEWLYMHTEAVKAGAKAAAVACVASAIPTVSLNVKTQSISTNSIHEPGTGY